MIVDPGLEFVDPAAELFEDLDHRLDPLGAKAEFLDQPHGSAAAADQAAAMRRGAAQRLLAAGGAAIVAVVPLEQGFERAEIVRQPAENLLLSKRSVTETWTVRSNGNSPSYTRRRTLKADCIT